MCKSFIGVIAVRENNGEAEKLGKPPDQGATLF